MAGKFEITKAGDTFSFELFIDDKAVGKSPVFDKEDACKRGVKAVKKNSRMKVQNTLANDEEKTNPKYLVEADGDMDKAVDFLRERGLAAAQKKATRIAAEGVVLPYYDAQAKKGVVVEVNSETDFVAKNEKFQAYVAQVAEQALETEAADIDAFLAETWKFDTTKTVNLSLIHI